MTDVKLLARWNGWCDPCETERPLVLTETGQRGMRAWLHGIGAEDRTLTLTCAVCGEWQQVPADEDDLPDETPAPSPVVALHALGAHAVVVHSAVPGRPSEPTRPGRATDRSTEALGLVAEGLDLISLAS